MRDKKKLKTTQQDLSKPLDNTHSSNNDYYTTTQSFLEGLKERAIKRLPEHF